MSEKFAPEQRERPSAIECKIVEPRGDKNFMIGFEGKTEEECRAYNHAIKTVLTEAGLHPFHQVGVSPFGEHAPGYHAWEIWKKAQKEDLETLVTKIQREAQEYLERWS